MAETYLDKPVPIEAKKFPSEFSEALEAWQITVATDFIWKEISKIDEHIQKTEPFKLVKHDTEKGKKIISELVSALFDVSVLLQPILPDTAEKIQTYVRENKMPSQPLFPRKD